MQKPGQHLIPVCIQPNGITEFYKLLGEFKMNNAITTETKEKRKKKFMNNVVKLLDSYFDSYET